MNGLFINGSGMEHSLQAFCWMLVHSLWQGLLLAIVAGIVMLLTKKARAATRYAIITSLFFAFLAVCCYTFIHEWNNDYATASPLAATGAFGNIDLLQHYGINQFPAALAQYCSDHATLIVALWFAIFCFRCWQMSLAFRHVHRIQRSKHQGPGAYWQHKISGLTQQLHIKRTVTLLESGITKIPVVIGHLKPVIYMPVGLLANLPPDQVEEVLMHELAHIRRNDYLVNLLQNIAETIFFFNPGLLWVSSLLKQEREHCCDDVALAHTGNKKQFIQALISFKEHIIYGSSHAMAFPGKKSHLLQRVARIVYNRNNSLSGGEKIFLLGSVLICFFLLGTMANKQEHTLPVNASAGRITVSFPKQSLADVLAAIERTQPIQYKPATPAGKPTTTKSSIKRQGTIVKTQDEQRTDMADAQQQVDQENRLTMKNANQAELDYRQAERDHQQAMRDREQAEHDRVLAERNREQAVHDRQLAEQHRVQAERDRLQATRDREQAAKDREQAERDRMQANRDRARAEVNRRQADRDRKQAEHNNIQSRQRTAYPVYPTP